jgi:hypothetical protein
MGDVDLTTLTLRESDLLAHVESLLGTIEDKNAALRADGTAAAYREVASGYLQFARSGSLEALKRALFLCWDAQVEPPCFTGLGDIDGDQIPQAKELMIRRLESGDFDDEYVAMIGWYARIADWWFSGIEAVPGLSDRIRGLTALARSSGRSGPDPVSRRHPRDGHRVSAMLRVDRGTVHGSPLRSDRVHRTRLARVHPRVPGCPVPASARP